MSRGGNVEGKKIGKDRTRNTSEEEQPTFTQTTLLPYAPQLTHLNEQLQRQRSNGGFGFPDILSLYLISHHADELDQTLIHENLFFCVG